MRRTRLAVRRKAMGFTQEGLAEVLCIDRSTIVRWERGVTVPQPWQQQRLADVLKLKPEELTDLLSDDDSTHSREMRLSLAALSTGPVDLIAVAQVRQRIQDLDGLYDQRPSSELLAEAAQLHGQIRHMSSQTAASRCRRDLRAAEAESALLLGQLIWDASQRRSHDDADRCFDLAAAAARDVGDSTTEAYAELRKCYVALYGRNDPRGGLIQAECAARSARESQVLRGLAQLHAGEAHAMLGDRTESLTALEGAAEALAAHHHDDVANQLYSATVHGRLTGSCHLFLGDPKTAESILAATFKQFTGVKKSAAIVAGNLSLSFIRQRKPDEAVHWLHLAIDVLEQTRGGGGLNVAFTAGRELRSWHNEPCVADVKDRLLMLMTAA